ncbi:MAG: A/G-specific adenine glycosylase [Nocardioidaceae bacterium]
MPDSPLHEPLLRWYAGSARDLPWRRADATPWAVLVSEVMLQQTPVARVLPAYDAWIERWPTPAALAQERPGEAVRMWGRLGYPRRALRLHEAAGAITDRHGGAVPSSVAALRALPGIGEYTAAAVRAFAFRRRAVVLDTNVRRVLTRLDAGAALPPPAVTTTERSTAERLLPDDHGTAADWSVAAMELGALVCTARSPACDRCPLAAQCAWRAAGCPAATTAARPQSYAGTDRECRGRILALLRSSVEPVAAADVDAVWQDCSQRERALASLVDDGLVVVQEDEGSFSLP